MSELHPMLGKWVCHVTDIDKQSPYLVTYVGQSLSGEEDYVLKAATRDGSIIVINMDAVECVIVEPPVSEKLTVSVLDHGDD